METSAVLSLATSLSLFDEKFGYIFHCTHASPDPTGFWNLWRAGNWRPAVKHKTPSNASFSVEPWPPTINHG